MSEPSSTDRYRAPITRAFALLEAADGSQTVAELAKAVGMSPFHFHRVFRALTGETVGGVAKRFRLARGFRSLRDTDRSVTEVGLAVGYDSPQNFARAFKALTGHTPSEARNDPELAARVFHQLGKPKFVPAEDFSPTRVTVVELPALHAIGLRHVGPTAGMGAVYQRLFAWLANRSLIASVQGIFTVYENDADEVPADQFRAIASVTVPDDVQPDDGLQVVRLGGGPHARLLHEGSYAGLAASYDALYGRWLPTSGRHPADSPPFEKYLNDPQSTPPDDLRTEIYLPLRAE